MPTHHDIQFDRTVQLDPNSGTVHDQFHDDVPVMIEDTLDRITTDLQVVRQAIQFHEES